MKRFRKCVFDIIQPYYGDSKWGRAFDTTIMTLILVSAVIAFAATFDLPQAVSGDSDGHRHDGSRRVHRETRGEGQ